MQVLIKKATILCSTSPFHLKTKDIFINNGIIEKIENSIVLDKNILSKNNRCKKYLC